MCRQNCDLPPGVADTSNPGPWGRRPAGGLVSGACVSAWSADPGAGEAIARAQQVCLYGLCGDGHFGGLGAGQEPGDGAGIQEVRGTVRACVRACARSCLQRGRPRVAGTGHPARVRHCIIVCRPGDSSSPGWLACGRGADRPTWHGGPRPTRCWEAVASLAQLRLLPLRGGEGGVAVALQLRHGHSMHCWHWGTTSRCSLPLPFLNQAAGGGPPGTRPGMACWRQAGLLTLLLLLGLQSASAASGSLGHTGDGGGGGTLTGRAGEARARRLAHVVSTGLRAMPCANANSRGELVRLCACGAGA